MRSMNITKFRTDLKAAMTTKKATQTTVAEETGVLQSSLSLFLSSERDGLSGENILKLLPFVYGNSIFPDLPPPVVSPAEQEVGR